MDRVQATEAGQHRPGPAEPRPLVCALCGFVHRADGYYLRPGDDRRMHEIGGEVICGLCATPADLGSRRLRGLWLPSRRG